MSSKEEIKIKSKYDLRKDLLLVIISKDGNRGKEIKLDENFILIFNSEGLPLFLEIYNASNIFEASKFTLSRINDIDLLINVEKDFIELESKFTLKVHNKNEILNFNFKVKNSENIPS
ncbi:hypothetical protein [Methanobrevibacter sp. DSM 116169]|uniref:hypothetical protein n=1 Tax=Methanobrevibacter sp. DSM 116169 TaxID=3242727 RepID=UPI0038FCC719